MSNTYNQKICNVNDIAKTLNGIMDTVTEGAELDIKIIPFENANNVAICYKEISGSGGGSSLPAVTASDNGDVLTVVDGEWDKAAPSGGDNRFFITPGEYNSEAGYAIADKTPAEIIDAVESGKNVYLVVPVGGDPNSGTVNYLPFMGGIRARVGSESIPTGTLLGAGFQPITNIFDYQEYSQVDHDSYYIDLQTPNISKVYRNHTWINVPKN